MKKVGLSFFLLFSFSIFVAKPAINISYGLLIVSALIYKFKYGKKIVTKNRFVVLLLVPIGVGFFFSFFSISGIEESINFIIRYRFLFLFLPFVLFIDSKEALLKIFIAMNAGAFIDIVYSMLNSDLGQPFGNIYGVHKFGRHSDMLFTLFLINATILLIKYKKKTISKHIHFYPLLFINTCFLLITVILIGQRGAYLGLYCGLIVLFLMYSKKLLIALIIITMVSPLFAPAYVLNRVKSIVDPTEISNSARLNLLKLGTDYLVEKKCWVRGTGAKSVKSEFEKFLTENSKRYTESFRESIKLFPGNFHNSYLQMTIEGGLLFAILYLSTIFYLLLSIYKKLRETDNRDNYPMACAVVCSMGFMISQFFHEEFFRYGGLVAYICFYSGCMIENKEFDTLGTSSNNYNL